MTAGADAFASGLFTRFDMTFLVAEPTRKDVSVYRQYRDHAREFGIPVAVVGDKVAGEDDLLFLQEDVGDDLLARLVQSGLGARREQGRDRGELKAQVPARAGAAASAVDARPEDWAAFQRHAVAFHLRDAARGRTRARGPRWRVRSTRSSGTAPPLSPDRRPSVAPPARTRETRHSQAEVPEEQARPTPPKNRTPVMSLDVPPQLLAEAERARSARQTSSKPSAPRCPYA